MAVEHMQERTGQQQQVRQDAKCMPPVFAKQVERSDNCERKTAQQRDAFGI